MARSAGTFYRGETVTLLAPVVLGDVGDVTSLPVCDMRRLTASGAVADPDGPADATLTVVPFAGTPDVLAGWQVSLSALASAALPPGTYALDLRMVVGSAVFFSDQVTLRLETPVTVR